MTTIAFAHVALNCRNMQATERFYCRYFGFRRARVIDVGSEQIVFLKAGSVYLELFQAHQVRPAAAPERDGDDWPGVRHLAFQVADVDAKLAELSGAADVTLGPLSFDDVIPGWRTAWLRDPDGNIVEISQGFCEQADPPPLAEPTPLATTG